MGGAVAAFAIVAAAPLAVPAVLSAVGSGVTVGSVAAMAAAGGAVFAQTVAGITASTPGGTAVIGGACATSGMLTWMLWKMKRCNSSRGC